MRWLILIAAVLIVGAWGVSVLTAKDDSPVTDVPGAPITDVDDVVPAEAEVVAEVEPLVDTDEEAGPRRIIVDDPGNFFGLMETIGLDNMEQRFSNWSLEHGYPFSDQTGVLLLEQPYNQYDDETLRAFAENEDMWAQQFLAKRLERTRPAEAIDWYRKAAINGSLYAMDQLTALYGRLGRARADGRNTDGEYKEQLLAVRDSVESTDEMSFAWSMASVMAGGDPGRNRIMLDTLGRNFDDDQQQRACDMASSLYSDLAGQRQSRGLEDFSRQPPPLMMGTFSDISALPCGGGAAVPHIDTTSCEEVVMVMGGTENELVVCGG
ncbi:MAG: hypothetical protein AAF465_11810 [Pseudomonadota bacterium]